jgi:hypothetical protein
MTVTSDNDELFIPFNDISVPTSGDWKIVQSWIMSNLYLKNVPAHYLIPDPRSSQRRPYAFSTLILTGWILLSMER